MMWCWGLQILCKIRDFLCGECLYCAVLSSNTVSFGRFVPTFRTNILPPSSVHKWSWRKYFHIYGCDYRRVMDWWMNLLITYTHHTELQVITALSLISTRYKSLLQLLCLRRYCTANIPQLNYSAISSQPPLQNSTDPLPQLALL
jgi:hypothetical protein